MIASNSLNAAAAPIVADGPPESGGDSLLSEINSITRGSAPRPAPVSHTDDLLGLMDGGGSNVPSTTSNGSAQMKGGGGANLLGDLLGDSGLLMTKFSI